MFHKSTTKKGKIKDEQRKSHFNPQYKARSTSQLLSPNAIIHHSISPFKSDRSTPHASTTSLATTSTTSTTTSTRAHLASLLKIPLTNRQTVMSQSTEDRFVMTLIKTPIDNTPRTLSSEPIAMSPTTEESPTNGKLFKSRVTAAFNHMKYRWVVRMRPNFRTNESPIYFLGNVYNGKEDTSFDDMPRPHCEQSYSNFLKAFSQRIYLSYRKQFEPLNGLTRSGDSITSDCGWGCMIRCAQMLLAQTLLLHWTSPLVLPYSNIQIAEKCPKRNSIEHFRYAQRSNRRTQTYMEIIRLFGDYPDVRCPFGIHKIADIGTTHGIRPGDFFGPVSAAHCLKEALQMAIETNQIADTLRIYISQDAIIYRDDVINLCSTVSSNSIEEEDDSSSSSSSNESESNENPIEKAPTRNWSSTSLLILVPLRLGLNEIDTIYEPYLKEALKLTQTVGIIGGSPRHAVYILGFQDESFIDLDPHFSQNTVNVLEETFDLSSYSCSSPKKLTARKMDPSCTLGFYCRDKADFEMFCAQWNHICHMATEDRRTCPIFRIERGTLEESHNRTLNYDYPSVTDDEHLLLRVTKLPASENNSPSSFHQQNSSTKKFNGSILSQREIWDDNGRLFSDNTKNSRTRQHSLSDDYVFL